MQAVGLIVSPDTYSKNDLPISKRTAAEVGWKMNLSAHLRHFGHVVVTFLKTKARETQRGLTTTAVLLWKLDRHLVQDLAGVAGEVRKEATVTVHDDETKFVVRLEKLLQRLNVELVVAQVQRGVDRLERLKVDRDLHHHLASGACRPRPRPPREHQLLGSSKRLPWEHMPASPCPHPSAQSRNRAPVRSSAPCCRA